MAKFIQKFNSLEAYNEAEHDYPNVSLVEGSGLLYQAEEPQPDPCFITETQEQFNANVAVLQAALQDFQNERDVDASFYILKSDVKDVIDLLDAGNINTLYSMLSATESFSANCESATIGLRMNTDESSYTIYQIGVEPDSNAKAPVPLEDYIEITVTSGVGITVNIENMQSDRYDFNIGYHPQ